MQNAYQILQSQMVIFLVLLAVGYGGRQRGIISDAAVDALPELLLHIILPAMLLTKLPAAVFERDSLPELCWIFVGAWILFAVQFLFAIGVEKILRLPKDTRRVHILVAALPNSAFVGYPLLFLMFPEKMPLFMVAYMMIDTIMLFGVAPLVLHSGSGKKDWRLLWTPTNIAFLIAVLLLLVGIHPVGRVWDTLAGLGSMSQYLGLIYIGGIVGRQGLRVAAGRWQIYIAAVFKLLVAPICIFGVLKAVLPLDTEYIMILSIMAAMPSMVTVCIQAKECGLDYEYAAAGLLITTIAGMATLPLVMGFCMGG